MLGSSPYLVASTGADNHAGGAVDPLGEVSMTPALVGPCVLPAFVLASVPELASVDDALAGSLVGDMLLGDIVALSAQVHQVLGALVPTMLAGAEMVLGLSAYPPPRAAASGAVGGCGSVLLVGVGFGVPESFLLFAFHASPLKSFQASSLALLCQRNLHGAQQKRCQDRTGENAAPHAGQHFLSESVRVDALTGIYSLMSCYTHSKGWPMLKQEEKQPVSEVKLTKPNLCPLCGDWERVVYGGHKWDDKPCGCTPEERNDGPNQILCNTIIS